MFPEWSRLSGFMTASKRCSPLNSIGKFHRLTGSNNASRPLEVLLRNVESSFHDKRFELRANVCHFVAKYKQPERRSHSDHLEENMRAYRFANIREHLTPCRYIEFFGVTQRPGKLCRPFMTVARRDMGTNDSSRAYYTGELEAVRDLCHALDRKEEHCSTAVHIVRLRGGAPAATRAAAAADATSAAAGTSATPAATTGSVDAAQPDCTPGGYLTHRGNRNRQRGGDAPVALETDDFPSHLLEATDP